jgi:TonB family protein
VEFVGQVDARAGTCPARTGTTRRTVRDGKAMRPSRVSIAWIITAALLSSSVAADAARRVVKKRPRKPVPVYKGPLVAPPVFGLARPAPPLSPPPPLPPLVNPPGVPPTPLNSPAEWFPQDSYPAEAKRAGETGRVVVRLRLDRQGRPYQCSVVGSSGWSLLDSTTCYLAQSNARFAPARGPDNRPIEWTYQLATRWQMVDEEEVAPPVPAPPTSPRRAVRRRPARR